MICIIVSRLTIYNFVYTDVLFLLLFDQSSLMDTQGVSYYHIVCYTATIWLSIISNVITFHHCIYLPLNKLFCII